MAAFKIEVHPDTQSGAPVYWVYYRSSWVIPFIFPFWELGYHSYSKADAEAWIENAKKVKLGTTYY